MHLFKDLFGCDLISILLLSKSLSFYLNKMRKVSLFTIQNTFSMISKKARLQSQLCFLVKETFADSTLHDPTLLFSTNGPLLH